MAVATSTGGSGYAPGYGKVTNTKPRRPSIGSALGSNIGAGAAKVTPMYKPLTPSSPPASAGSAPQVDGVTPLPPDATYDLVLSGLGKTRDDTIAGLEGQKTSTLADYGYTATYNDKGDVASLAVDPNNPYSRAAQLKKSYDNSKRGALNGMAAAGQLYSGALTNAQNTNDSNFSQSSDTMQKNLGQILASIIGGQRTARTNYETGVGQAYGDRVGRAGQSPLYSPTTEPAAAAAPSTADLIKQWVANPIKTTYTNSSGHPVRVYGDGHKEVSTDGGKTWKRA